MRCPDCSKFVSMENADPEVDNLEISYDEAGRTFTATANVRAVRTCAECGTELKDYNFELEKEIPLEDFVPQDAEERGAIIEKLAAKLAANHDDISYEIQEDTAEANDGGGSRYAKNMISISLTATATIKIGSDEYEAEVELSDSAAASSFEECC